VASAGMFGNTSGDIEGTVCPTCNVHNVEFACWSVTRVEESKYHGLASPDVFSLFRYLSSAFIEEYLVFTEV
jgi:hypothetical protein